MSKQRMILENAFHLDSKSAKGTLHKTRNKNNKRRTIFIASSAHNLGK